MNIGFVGLGIMGLPMAKNLLKAGFTVYAWNRTAAKTEALAACGAVPSDFAGIGENCGIVISMLTDAPQTEQVFFGANGLAACLRPGQIVVDMSSAAPEASRALARRFAALGVEMLDAPVSGGETKAVDGTLSIMAGGKPEVFERCREVFAAMGSSAVLCGGAGAGSTAKLVNQVIVAGNIAVLAEGLTLARLCGAEPGTVWQAIRGGAAGSEVLETKGPMMLASDFRPGGMLDLHAKDLRHVLEAGHAAAAPLPMTEMIMEIMNKLRAEGLGRCDHSVLIRYYEEIAGEPAGEKQ